MKNTSKQKGFSIVELIIVLTVIVILSVIAVMTFSSGRKYDADDQARRLVDMFDEARQKALNQRTTFRVEINRTKQRITLIDENDPPSQSVQLASDDVIVKSLPFTSQITIGAMPANVTAGPPATSPINVPTYATSTYPLSSGDQKITLRFTRKGRVVDTGTDNIGTGSQPAGATIYVYPATAAGINPNVIRAVVVLGTSGDTSIYKCAITAGVCGNWIR